MSFPPFGQSSGHHVVERPLHAEFLFGSESRVGGFVAERQPVEAVGFDLFETLSQGGREPFFGGLRILGTRQSGLTVEGADDFRSFLTKRFGLFEFLGRKASSGRQRHDIHAVGHIGEKAAPADGSLVRIVEPDDRPIMVAVLVGAERGEVTGIQSGIVFAENRVFDCDFLVLRPVVARGARRCCEQKRRAAEYVAYRSFHDSNDNGLFLLAVPPQTGGHVVGSPEQ